MVLIKEILLLIMAFALLIYSAELLLKGATQIALRLKVSVLLIGMTIVAFGTSLPELLISLQSNMRGEGDFIVSNIIGSNMSNILLVLGFSVVFKKIRIKQSTLFHDIPFSIFITILLGIMINIHLVQTNYLFPYVLDRIEGVLLIILFLYFTQKLWYTLQKNSSKNIVKTPNDTTQKPTLSLLKCTILVILGFLGLFFGGQLVINNCIIIVELYGLSKGFVGLSIIALGTSLPELLTSIYAAINKNEDIAVGNVIGSNIFNILWVLGITATVHPVKYYDDLNLDIIILIVVNIIIFLLIYLFKKSLNRFIGIFLILSYIVYIYFNYLRFHDII